MKDITVEDMIKTMLENTIEIIDDCGYDNPAVQAHIELAIYHLKDNQRFEDKEQMLTRWVTDARTEYYRLVAELKKNQGELEPGTEKTFYENIGKCYE